MKKQKTLTLLFIGLLFSAFFTTLINFPYIAHAATFGNTSTGGSSSNVYADNKVGANFTLSENAELTSITAQIRDYAESGQANAVRYGVYNSSGDLEGSTNVGNTPAAWAAVTLDFASPLSLNAGEYWLMEIFGARTEFRYDAGGINQYFTNGDTFSDGFADPMGSGSNQNWALEIYATYTPVGAEDSTPPTYSFFGKNNTIAGQPTQFNLTANDETTLNPNGLYVLSTNNTGVWANQTAANFTATPQTASVVITLNSTEDLVIGYKFYFSDSGGNWNETTIKTLTTTNSSGIYLFAAYHETGDLSEYDASANATASTVTTHHGSYSMRVENQTGGANMGYGSVTINPDVTRYYIRWYLNFSRWPVNTEEHYWFVVGNGSQGIVVGTVGRVDGSEIYIYSSGFFEVKWYSANVTCTAGSWHEFELELQEGYDGEGFAILRCNGTQQINVPNVEVFADSGSLTFNWGINNNPSETGDDFEFFYDCVTVTTQHLGEDLGGEEPADTTAPTYSDLSTSTTAAGVSCNFNATFTDETALEANGQYEFGTNNTGVWAWESAVNFTSTPETASVAKTLNSTIGVTVSYQWNFTDNAGNSNTTGVQTLVTTGDIYTLTLTVTAPTNTTYTSTVPIELSTSGNDTNPVITWNFQFSNGTWLYGSNQTYSVATDFSLTENATGRFCGLAVGDHESDYKEVYLTVQYFTYYTLSLTVTNPTNTTYTSSSIPVALSSSGNDTNPVYSWNAQFSNSSWLYGSNQTGTSATMTIAENQTNVLFACVVTGDNGASDYAEVYFSINITSTYTLTLTVTSPTNSTYTTTSVSVQLSSSGNDTNPVITWNVQYSNGTWLYGSNQTYSGATSMTLAENATLTFCGHVVGDNLAADYKEVMFTTYFVEAAIAAPELNETALYISLMVCAIAFTVLTAARQSIIPSVISTTSWFALGFATLTFSNNASGFLQGTSVYWVMLGIVMLIVTFKFVFDYLKTNATEKQRRMEEEIVI